MTYRVELRNGKSFMVDADTFDMSPLMLRIKKNGHTVSAYATDLLESIVELPVGEIPERTKPGDGINQCYFTKWEKPAPEAMLKASVYNPMNDCILTAQHTGHHRTPDGRWYHRLTSELIVDPDGKPIYWGTPNVD
jgi:hypothetical protein